MANTLFLRLEGPLQAWGERARWSVRDSAPEPTKSGMVGLLACALGLSDDDDLRELSVSVRLGIRCDRPGVPLVDYHTVVEGVLSAEGKIKMNSKTKKAETVVSWRHYLCDASFLAAVRAEASLVERLSGAVQAPHWPVYLGRKSCPPSRPLFEGAANHASLEEALLAWPYRSADGSTEPVVVRAVVECGPADGVRRRDEIVSRSRRSFGPRYSRDVPLTLTPEGRQADVSIPIAPEP